MLNDEFVEYCKARFSYLIEEYGFQDCIIESDCTRISIIYEVPGIKVKITNHVIEYPHFPIVIYLIADEDTLMGRLLNRSITCDLDDLLVYRECCSQVYEYIDYASIDSFYVERSDEEIEYYEKKYSSDEEIKFVIDRYAILLKEYASDVLNGNFEILPEIRKLREENDKKNNRGSYYN
jgi:hypothetical protein